MRQRIVGWLRKLKPSVGPDFSITFGSAERRENHVAPRHETRKAPRFDLEPFSGYFLPHMDFYKMKIEYTDFLRTFLKIGRIRPIVLNAVQEINGLPFACTIESGGGVFRDKELREICTSVPALMEKKPAGRGNNEKVVYEAPYVVFNLNGSMPEAYAFLRGILEWKEKRFPKAAVTTDLGIEVRAPYSTGANDMAYKELPIEQAIESHRQSQEFMQAFEKFLHEKKWQI